MTQIVKAADIMDVEVFENVSSVIEGIVQECEGDNEKLFSVYLSLKLLVSAIEEEFGIDPVEIQVGEEG